MATTPELRYPYERQEDYPAWIAFNTFQNPSASVQSRVSTNDQAQQGVESFKNEGSLIPNSETVSLYLPGSLTFPGAVNYENAALGARGSLVLQGIQQGNSALGIAKKSITDNAKTAMDMFNSGGFSNAGDNPVIQNLIAKVVSRGNILGLELGQDIKDAAQAGLRITDNPNFRTLFRDVPIRTFNFEFEMRPESEQEMRIIKDIIKYFRRELYPTRIPSPEGTNITFGYNFPRTFNIRAFYKRPDGFEQRLGHRFKPAYLTSFNVVYNPDAPAFFEGGEFTTYSMSMEFTEIRALTAEDIEEDF